MVPCLPATMREVMAGRGASFTDIDTARQRLAAQPDCTGRIGIIGFCLGGAFALQMAPGYGFGAAGVNYGMGDGNIEATLRGACPIVGSFGRKDRTLRGAAARLERALTALGIDHDVKEYQDTGHSFLNDHRGAGARVVFTLLGPMLGPDYHEPSAQDARRRILAFFDRHLKPAT